MEQSQIPPTQREHRILKELSNPHKTMSLVGIDLEARQFALIAGLLAPLALAFRLGLFRKLDLTAAQNTAIIAPFVVAVVCFAFLKWDGRELSFIVMKKFQSLMREKLLVWRARPPNSVMWLRDSVQRYLPLEEPVWDMLKTNNGTYLRIVEIEASSLSLASEEQQERMRSRLAEAYTAFDFPVTEITRSRPSAMGTYIARLQDEMEAELGRPGISEHKAIRLRTFGENHVAHLKQIVSERHAYEHRSYIVVTWNPARDEKQSSNPVAQIKDMLKPLIPFVGRPTSKRSTKHGQEETIRAYRVLSERVETVKEYYGRLGLTPRPLGEHEALAFAREEAGGANLSGVDAESGAPAETQTPFAIGPIITLTGAQYEKLSEHALKRRVDAARQVISEDELEEASGWQDAKAAGRTPPVVGLGELAVNDRIAPDAVEIGSDMLRVGASYHRTLYVYDLPETVRVGFLQSLAEMKYRIKIVKYIRPIQTRDALDIIGRKKSQLLASERTTSQGDVRERERKQLAHKAAEYALKAVQSGTQRYYELAVLIHLEADSPAELENLTDKVKTKLDEKYVSSRLALEEMFEGYVSCLPFGENHLAEKQCFSGILTDPLSCFSTFSSLEINHLRGVLYGTDKNTGAPVMLDDTELSNRHKIVLGGSGQGKTVLVKALSTRSRFRGETNILIDPEGRTRYERVARRVGGQFTKLGQGSTSRINPFDLTGDYPDLDRLGDAVDEDEDPEQALRVAREGAFHAKVTTLVSLIGLMATATDSAESARGGLTPAQRGRVERVIAEVYEDAGINRNPATHDRTPPVMGDFFAKLAGHARRDEKLADLLEDLYSWHQGALSNIFDGPTNVDLRSKYLVVRIQAAENGPEKAPLMFVLLDFLRGRLADPRESITCYIDEMWSLLKYPMAVDLLNQLWRASRASGTSMVGITQDLEEFLGSQASQTIMRQSQTYCLLGQSKSTISQIGAFIELSDKTRENISNYARGEALLVAGQRQLPLNINISAEEKELFHTDAANVRRNAPTAKPEAASTSRSEGLIDGGTSRNEHLAQPARAGATTLDTLAPGSPNGHQETTPVRPDLSPTGAFDPPRDPKPPAQPPRAPEANGAPVRRRTRSPDDRAGSIYAISGPCSAEVVFSLTGISSTAATEQGIAARVAMVDASGALSATEPFSGIQLPPTDALIRALRDGGAGGLRLDDYLISDRGSGLHILRAPEDPECPAAEIAALMSANFDCVVAACAKEPAERWGPYAREWALRASRLAVVAQTPRRLSREVDSLREIEGLPDTEPLLVLAGDAIDGADDDRLPDGATASDVFILPDASELARCMSEGAFYTHRGGAADFARLAYHLEAQPA